MIVSILRKEARENLKGKWKKAILMMLIFFITTSLLEILRNWIATNTFYGKLAFIINFVVTISIGYGLSASLIKLKRNEKVNVLHFIYYTIKDGNKYWRMIGRALFNTSGYLALLVLFGYFTVLELISLYNGNGMRLTFFIEIIGTIVVLVLFIMKVLYYSLNIYILFDNKEHKSKNILKESERLMKNHRWDFIKLWLSFSGWFLLVIIFGVVVIVISNLLIGYIYYEAIYLISCISLVFLLPYINITNICFYDNLLYNNPKPKEEINTKPKRKSKNSNKKNKKNK